jgi:cyclase
MVSKRIIPCLDVDNGRVVKGTNFVDIKDAGDPVELAKKYAADGADELVFLDITASSDKRIILKDIVQRVAKEIFIPFTVGGGIDSIEMIQEVLDLGADKVSLNTAALRNPQLIKDASNHFGSQCIVIAVDVKRRGDRYIAPEQLPPLPDYLHATKDTQYDVYSHGGRNNVGLDAIEWIKYCESLGAGECLLTSMDRDGTNDGYDTHLLRMVKSFIHIPVIASGGAGSIKDIYDVLTITDAALLASLLHYEHLTVQDIKASLHSLKIRTI